MDEATNAALAHMIDVVAAQDGQLVLAKNEGEWVVGCFFGVEAPDSPMAAGAAHGLADTLDAAVQQAAEQMGWKAEVRRFLRCYDADGRETAAWQVHTAVVALADAPKEATHAIHSAFLVVAEDSEGKRILKSRDRLTNEGVDPDLLLAELRAHPRRAVSPDALTDSERPRVDGTPCPWRGRSENLPAIIEGKDLRCALGTGHEGGHDPVPIVEDTI